jgi:hypothetical protein
MLYPMFALVVFTFFLLTLNLFWRVQAVRQKRISLKYLRTFEGDQAPMHIKMGARHFANLFEMPVLFYAAAITALAMNLVTPILVNLAWAFVVCRIIHAAIHMTYNHVGHRALAFWFGSLTVLLMWVFLVMNYSARSLS